MCPEVNQFNRKQTQNEMSEKWERRTLTRAVDYGPDGPVDYGLRPVDYASETRCGLRMLAHAVD